MSSTRKKSLADIQAAIDKLQKEAQAIRAKELDEVIARIKTAIEHYQLTPADLGFAARASRPGASAGASRGAGSKGRSKPARKIGVIKYRDDAGNAWTGVGKRPRWYLQALAAGKKPEDLLVK